MKTVIISGASKGLGRALTNKFLSENYNVIGISRTSNDIRSLNFYEINGDVSDEMTVDRAFAKANEIGGLKFVISCAGRGVFGPVGGNTRVNLDEVLRGNLIGTILVSERAVQEFEFNGGVIVNIMSTAAQIARKNESIYCASKWGARGYTESLRLELKGSKTAVIAIYPGGMDTTFWENAINSEVDSSSFMNAEKVAKRIYTSLKNDDSSYVSDITINRK